ncbi:hypothetical protein FZEAL_9210 [Fusarium zealandicum]|uniref:Uncharacterized protein n=1 Tax=Fusarium zealandicum TaxID=1053134 RepID=A0A8H4XGX5_9HYPO|nr:hypothetical protein FZEAL_9210 [Fusarium zealandicum]
MPEPASIHDVIRQHPRERLLVQPLEWTSQHLRLLRCSFEELDVSSNEDTQTNAADKEESGQKKPVDRWARTAERLATYEMKTAAVKKLLAEADGPLKFLRPYGFFCFSTKHEFRLHGTTFTQRSSNNSAPVFAFMQRGMINTLREGVFSLPRPRRPNPPAEEIRRLRLKQIVPSDPRRDPYIVGVLLGLAQSQAESLLSKMSGSEGIESDHVFKVCAALVDEKDTEFMYFYTASISAAFLSKFEYPEKLHPFPSAMSADLCIQYRGIPFLPYSTLRTRLLDVVASSTNRSEDGDDLA